MHTQHTTDLLLHQRFNTTDSDNFDRKADRVANKCEVITEAQIFFFIKIKKKKTLLTKQA